MKYLLIATLLIFGACKQPPTIQTSTMTPDQFLVVLGIAQDAGYPQAACTKDCCKNTWENPVLQKQVTCLGLVDKTAGKIWLFEATPDFKFQLQQLASYMPTQLKPIPDGIFLTHAHMGHYTGLMDLGREAIGAKEVPVYAMPRMKNFLEKNEPWRQLVTLKNIDIRRLQADSSIILSKDLRITPFLVPHRDELSETVGYQVEGPNRKVLFIPDIDKWHKWDRAITEEVKKVDLAFLDGTFFQNGEIPNRDMSLIPHPFIEESVALFKELPSEHKKKIHFIHFNHTNPALQPNSLERRNLLEQGFLLAEEQEVHGL